MAKLRAYLKGSTESIEWNLPVGIDLETIPSKLPPGALDTWTMVPTATGWVLIDPGQYAALELIK
ncbi:hypothetical protein [Gordonia sp. (in: high G+C Gram-positive bacteria)]|jgi:hypothetical protein|uniref:hypothetical protein n=1 Tax=Gordonia sp. (in: high G+C Gram-positive bacteria) TaxID=84139 RepID=UPI001D6A983A|nr:hypothetical protein [Gordonia sp. (in: high G+C Gram-positive bacteria)]MCB1296112.1 hypothetical protein [Gordonia sp. (in: high G+C Gram-positive bacteria)]HMS74126.1 hypothetical protein [Gordonia sp. (in: high G+C Gram-positive bacteria)]HQV21006.1 hypothetical protein [Gordonia sp. (in: high G+C Gram-positive bacteria)]